MRDLLLIASVCVFIVDISGWTESWKTALAKWAGVRVPGRVRPFDCSLCCTWWACLLWCICTGRVTLLWLAGCALAAASTPLLLAAWNCARTAVAGVLDWLTIHFDNWTH